MGTANTLICIKNKGIVLNETSVVSYYADDGIRIGYLYGNKANDLIGKTPLSIVVSYPIEEGVVKSNQLTEDMISEFLKRAIGNNLIVNPIAIVGVPFSATEVEKKALQEIIDKCNVRESYLIYESIASAIGYGIKIDKPEGNMIIDIGGGTTEISVISLGGIIKNRTIKIGGRKIDFLINDYFIKKYNLMIGEKSCEEIKKRYGVVFLKNEEENKKFKISGRNLITHIPEEIEVNSYDIVKATAEFTNEIVDNIDKVLEITPPELIKDIVKNGIVLCGGGAMMKNLDYVIEQTTGIKTFVAEEPELCLINGLQKIIQNYKAYNDVLFKQN